MESFAIVGLGKMGAGLARQALEKGCRVVGFTLGGAAPDLAAAGLHEAATLDQIAALLPPPRLVLLYIPAGSAVDETLAALAPILSKGDIVADCGNSYWGDSIRRALRLRAQGISFLDIGTSGGPAGARHGACFMAGGDDDVIAAVAPLLRRLAVDGGFVHTGPVGSGHFTKLVHNGIEFGMLQAIGEGLALLEALPPALPVPKILECWRHGSVIRSWLIDLMAELYAQRQGLQDVNPFVEDTGEVNWLIDDALHLEVSVPVISQAVMQLLASRDSTRNAARAVALMRHGFGGHPFGEDSNIAKERHSGRVGGFTLPGAP